MAAADLDLGSSAGDASVLTKGQSAVRGAWQAEAPRAGSRRPRRTRRCREATTPEAGGGGCTRGGWRRRLVLAEDAPGAGAEVLGAGGCCAGRKIRVSCEA